MTLVLDTGCYLLLAAQIGRSSRPLLALAKSAKRLDYRLSMSSLAWAECAGHICYAQPSAPYHAWEQGEAVGFMRNFQEMVSVHSANADDLIEAAKWLRRAIDPRIDPKDRRGPTLADASTAYLAQQLNAELVVTDDLADFRLLLRDFDGEMVTPRQLVAALA